MSNTIEKQECQLLTYFRHLSLNLRQETIDFAGYLMAKSETLEEATEEILSDKNMMLGIKQGLDEIERGEVSDVEF
jgi:hypothetical protein